MVHVIRLTMGLLFACGMVMGGEHEPLEELKSRMAQAECNHLEFLSLVESSVFETTDTVAGEAWLAEKGQFNVHLGADQYLGVDRKLFSYSTENNQVTVEDLPENDIRSEQLSFLTRLDEFFTTAILDPGRKYQLDIKDTTDADLPHLIHIYLSNEGQLDYLEYSDVNDDLNRIRFLRHKILSDCSKDIFTPNFPDSVEIIRLTN